MDGSARLVRAVVLVGTSTTHLIRQAPPGGSRSWPVAARFALPARAADELTTGAGIDSRTIHRLLLDAHTEGGLPRGCLLVVDEAGMAETRALAPLLELVDRAGGKAILVGDPEQLPAVGAGGLFPALCEQLGAIDLVENRRQRDLCERRALEHLRHGDAETYLAHAARRRLDIEEDATVAKQRLLEDW